MSWPSALFKMFRSLIGGDGVELGRLLLELESKIKLHQEHVRLQRSVIIWYLI